MSSSEKNHSHSNQSKVVEGTPKRCRESPESAIENCKRRVKKESYFNSSISKMGEEIGKMSKDELLAAFSALLDSKKYATRDDVFRCESRLKELKEENISLKKEIESLKSKEKKREVQMDDLENRMKSRNLIFQGLEQTHGDDDYLKLVETFCSEVFGIERNKLKLIDVHPIGRVEGGQRLLAYFASYQAAVSVLKKTNRLNGTGFAVYRDYAYGTRKRIRKLLVIKKELRRLNTNVKVTLRADRMFIERHMFEWDDIQGLVYNGFENGVQKLREILQVELSELVKKLMTEQFEKGAEQGGSKKL